MRVLVMALCLCSLAPFGFSVEQFGTDTTRQYVTVGSAADGLNIPTDLQFNPDEPSQLWVVNRGFEGTVMYTNPGSDNQEVDKRRDAFASHFMANVSSIAFGAHTFRNGLLTFATCQEDLNRNFMGPTLWPAPLDVYARVNQRGPLLGSHIDMLHQSPYCLGIVHDRDNIFWVADGRYGHIVRYDFVQDHGPGRDDHSDGIVYRYTEAEITRVAWIPAHVELDRESGWLYAADTGGGRIIMLDTNSGRSVRNLPQRNEPLAEFKEFRGASTETFAEGLTQPSGVLLHESILFVSDHATSEIIAYDTNSRNELARITTPADGIMGLTIGPANKLWYTDGEDDELVRIDP